LSYSNVSLPCVVNPEIFTLLFLGQYVSGLFLPYNPKDYTLEPKKTIRKFYNPTKIKIHYKLVETFSLPTDAHNVKKTQSH